MTKVCETLSIFPSAEGKPQPLPDAGVPSSVGGNYDSKKAQVSTNSGAFIQNILMPHPALDESELEFETIPPCDS